MSIPVNLSFGQLPTGYCMNSFAQLATDILSLMSGSLPGTFTGVVQGPDKPQVSDQDKAWIKTDASGNPIGLYFFSNGSWVWPNPISPGDQCIRPFLTNSANTPADVFSYDGGDGTDPAVTLPTPYSGAMWTIVGRTVATPLGTMQGSTPIGVGTVTNADTTTKVITEGQVGGEAAHALIPAELWHQHAIGKWNPSGWAGASSSGRVPLLVVENGAANLSATPGTLLQTPHTDYFDNAASANVAGEAGTVFVSDVPVPVTTVVNSSQPGGAPQYAAVSHNTLPPFVAVYWIQRTSRVYYVGG